MCIYVGSADSTPELQMGHWMCFLHLIQYSACMVYPHTPTTWFGRELGGGVWDRENSLRSICTVCACMHQSVSKILVQCKRVSKFAPYTIYNV